jgi:tetratricopeptide (TPR) repeat protein
VTLEPSQEIAWFNLGLAYAVEGNLEQALPAYESALELDPDVNDEAVVDLENALVDYPGVAGVNFALATLYEAEGRKDESIDQFEAYLSQIEDDTSPFGRTALQRLEVLRAPPPPLEIGGEVNVTLGRGGDALNSFEPGDRIYPTFELFTPGIELPRLVTVSYDLVSPSGDSILGEPLVQESDIPQNVVAIDIDGVGITLPKVLETGLYSLNIRISTPDGRETDQMVNLVIGDTPSLLRQFVSRNITMRAIDSGAPLYDGSNLATGDDRLVAVLLEELRQTASLAAEALPPVEEGRFAGLDGEALFLETSEEDISDFLNYLLASPGTTNADFSFVEAYAQWALEGAPVDP